MALLPGGMLAQLTTGTLTGILRAADGRPVAGSRIFIRGGTGFHTIIHPDSSGGFTVTLPYGRYRLSAGREPGETTVFVAPLQTTHLDLEVDASGTTHGIQPAAASGHRYPEASSLAGLLVSREPSGVTAPLNFGGLNDNRLAVASQRALSWTDTRYKLLGMDATDAYQPGHPAVFPDVQALDAVVVSSSPEVGLFLHEPGSSWHAALSTANTGDALSSTNLPPPALRGLVRQADQFQWFTRDRLEVGGPIARWADIYASASGQWASQTEPLAAPGADLRSRLLFGNVRGRIRATNADRFDALYSGSRIDLSDGGIPAGLEALTGNRMAPSFVLPGGFPGQPETDHLDSVQVGWTHLTGAASGWGILEVRYGYSTAHLDTNTSPNGQSRIELLGGGVSGAAPLANLAVRPRHEIEAVWQPGVLLALGTRHRVAVGGGWETSGVRNRFTTPSGMNLITANGAPAFVIEFNTPLDSRERVRSVSGFVSDHVNLTPSLSLDLGALADFSRGSLPAQSSPSGASVSARTFAASGALIVWSSLSPHAGFAWRVPDSHGLVLRGTYTRLYAPLAARYLDFGNPNSLGGSVYQWLATGGQGNLLLHFGGPYSSISPALRRPYSDEFDIGATFPIFHRSAAGIHLFRRDDKDRIAAINTGVPDQAFSAVSVLDPGPDGIPGTFDDQRLTVYAQNPATLGQDRYLLTNPAGLRTLDAGLLAEAGMDWRGVTLHASFVAEKSYGPTNPGDSVYANDPGVVGALFSDPNTAINAAGRSFVDRAYIGKLQAGYRLPAVWGGIEVASVAEYMDGLAFARQLLVTGLPQGPLLVAATVRGSPGGGNRAQHITNWDLRLSRRFRVPAGGLTLSADLFNATNAGHRLQEQDLTGPSFNLRLPVSIQPARQARIGFRYEF